MITRIVHISAHIFLGGAEVIHYAGVDQIKCALYMLIAALMVREMWLELRREPHVAFAAIQPDISASQVEGDENA